jgi:nucleoid DNA-binding protein
MTNEDDENTLYEDSENDEFDETTAKLKRGENVEYGRSGRIMNVPIARKHEIVKKMSKLCGYKMSVCSETFEAFTKAIAQLVLDENHVFIRGLGTLVLRKTRRRKIEMYGKIIEVRPLKKVSFEMSSDLKRRVSAERLDETEDDSKPEES